MSTPTTISNTFTLNLKDAGRAAIMLFVTTFLAAIYSSIATVPIHLPTLSDLKADAIAGGLAALGYLIKNYFSDTVAQAQATITDAAKKKGLDTTVTVTPTSIVTKSTT